MSYWSFVHGTVTVLPFGRTQAEKRYLLDTVSVSYTHLDVFRQIASNMDLTNFDRYVTEAETRIDEDGTKYEKFCDRAKKIMEDYKLNLNYKTVLEQDDICLLYTSPFHR